MASLPHLNFPDSKTKTQLGPIDWFRCFDHVTLPRHYDVVDVDNMARYFVVDFDWLLRDSADSTMLSFQVRMTLNLPLATLKAVTFGHNAVVAAVG